MVNKNFCMSSFLAYRYIERDGAEFAEGLHHRNFRKGGVPDIQFAVLLTLTLRLRKIF